VVLQDVPPLAMWSQPAQVFTYRPSRTLIGKSLGAAVDPYKNCFIENPPITKTAKYRNETQDFGFDLSNGQEYFRYEKFRPAWPKIVRLIVRVMGSKNLSQPPRNGLRLKEFLQVIQNGIKCA